MNLIYFDNTFGQIFYDRTVFSSLFVITVRPSCISQENMREPSCIQGEEMLMVIRSLERRISEVFL